jgi:hypothetical protein
MSGQCKECRWWEHTGGAAWGACLLTYSSLAEPMYLHTLALAYPENEDGDTCLSDDAPKAGLATAPTFGCVQFEARKEGNE